MFGQTFRFNKFWVNNNLALKKILSLKNFVQILLDLKQFGSKKKCEFKEFCPQDKFHMDICILENFPQRVLRLVVVVVLVVIWKSEVKSLD